MRKMLFLMAIGMLLMPISFSSGFSDKVQDCSKCHGLKEDEALTLLKNFAPNLKIMEIRTSPIPGMWEVDIEVSGKKHVTYIDFQKKHFIPGPIIEIKGRRNLTQERLMEINKVDVSQIPLADALVMGDKMAKYKVIVFDDPD